MFVFESLSIMELKLLIGVISGSLMEIQYRSCFEIVMILL